MNYVSVKGLANMLNEMIEKKELEPDNLIYGARILEEDDGEHPAQALYLLINTPQDEHDCGVYFYTSNQEDKNKEEN